MFSEAGYIVRASLLFGAPHEAALRAFQYEKRSSSICGDGDLSTVLHKYQDTIPNDDCLRECGMRGVGIIECYG